MPDYGLDANARKALATYLANAQPGDAQAALAERKRFKTPADAQIEAGRLVYVHAGCGGCHSPDLKGGVPNPNAQGGEVLALIHLQQDYTKDEVLAIVRKGKAAPTEDAKKPAPPLYMPQWKGVISDEDIQKVVAYLWANQEKGKQEESW